jgi:hypothetical protein
MTSTQCAYADSDTPSRYVAETLPVAETEAFEEHYFSCARCWQEVQTGTAARAVLTYAQRTQEAPRQTRWWMTLAAAAVIGIIALVTIRDRAARDVPDVLRGDAEHTIAVVAERETAQLRIRWRAVARASRYEIAVRSAEGDVLQQKSSAATTIVLDGIPDGDVFLRVTAYSQGEEIARSRLVRVPSRRP